MPDLVAHGRTGDLTHATAAEISLPTTATTETVTWSAIGDDGSET